MLFNVCDISEYDKNEIEDTIIIDELYIIESGLSGGELRQAILDRIKEDLRYTTKNIKINMEQFEYDINVKQDKQEILNEIDVLIYELCDEDLTNTKWFFKNENIIITEDEE